MQTIPGQMQRRQLSYEHRSSRLSCQLSLGLRAEHAEIIWVWFARQACRMGGSCYGVISVRGKRVTAVTHFIHSRWTPKDGLLNIHPD
jgi:hypothetical protein